METDNDASGSEVPHRDELLVRQRNERRLSHRRAAETVATRLSASGRQSLTRDGGPTLAAGQFETLEAVPERQARETPTMGQEELNQFLSAFAFDPTDQVLSFLEQTTTAPNRFWT